MTKTTKPLIGATLAGLPSDLGGLTVRIEIPLSEWTVPDRTHHIFIVEDENNLTQVA